MFQGHCYPAVQGFIFEQFRVFERIPYAVGSFSEVALTSSWGCTWGLGLVGTWLP